MKKQFKLNKKLILLCIVLNFIGVFSAWYTYSKTLSLAILNGQWYLSPLIPVSMILYFTMTIFLLYSYYNIKAPRFFAIFTYYINFVYGLGGSVFFIVYMFFTKFSLWYLWYVPTHLFLGLLSLYILISIKEMKMIDLVLLVSITLLKDFSDIYLGVTSYFLILDKSEIYFTITLIVVFQLLGLYLLHKKAKQTFIRKVK